MSLKSRPLHHFYILTIVILAELFVLSKQEGLAVMSDFTLQSDSSSRTIQDDCGTVNRACNQLVLYQPVFPVLQQDKRLFEFAGKKWEICQQWDKIGISAVIWEAVRLVTPVPVQYT